MKLIIQIPCLNEELTLPHTLAELPRAVAGFDRTEWLVIDDGSTDRTVEVAQQMGVHHVISHGRNKGLAYTFHTGLTRCLELGADVIVNIDADNQYPSRYIEALVAPILDGGADMVIGDRRTRRIKHFSPTKRLLQRIGSMAVRYVSHTRVPDAPSGFRALSREAALRMNLLTGYTYTLDTIVQAGKKNLAIAHIPIETNPPLRRSRLIRREWEYVARSAVTMLKLFVLYEPFRTFAFLSLPFLLAGIALWIRFIILVALGEAGRGSNVQSIIAGSAALVIGFLVFLFGLLAELVAANRRMHEETLYYLKKIALSDSQGTSRDEQLAKERSTTSSELL